MSWVHDHLGFGLFVAAVLIVAVVLSKLSDVKWRLLRSILFPGLFAFLGLVSIFTGKFPQGHKQWVTTAIEGPLAYTFGATLFVIGLCVSFSCYRKTKEKIAAEERAFGITPQKKR